MIFHLWAVGGRGFQSHLAVLREAYVVLVTEKRSAVLSLWTTFKVIFNLEEE